VINVISKMPTQDYEADGYFEAGSYGTLNAFGAINVPMGDIASVRGAFTTINHDAVFQNFLSPGENYGDRHEQAGRVTALINPTEDLSIILRAGIDNEHNHGYPGQVTVPLSKDPFDFAMQTPGQLDQDQSSGQVTINYRLPFGTLTYDGGIQRSYAYQHAQIPGSPVQLYADPTASRSQQHELRLANTTDTFKYVVGVYYFDEFQRWMIYVDPAVTFLMPHEYDGSRAAYG
jgi:hypothetical protein